MEKNTSKPLFSGAKPDQVAADLAKLVDFQPNGLHAAALQEMIVEALIPHLMRYDMPEFQSMFNTFPPPEARLGAQIALDYNQGVTNWEVSPGGAVLEELCCQELCRLFALSPTADATFMYSGTYANQQAVYMALHRYAERNGFDLSQKGLSGFKDLGRLAILVSADAHFSLKHAVRILGLGDGCLVPMALDSQRRIDIHAMEKILQRLKTTRDVFCMVATAGTTNTGAIDPLARMADLCERIGAWLHVDGAYGYAYKLVPEWAERFAGDERADSIVWDPHKQIGAPIPNSVLFVQEKAEFKRMSLYSSYFNREEDLVPNPGIKSMPSTRPMSVLPLVTILRGRGLDQVIEDLRSPLTAIQALAQRLTLMPDVELMHQPDTGILCFRMTPEWVLPSDLDALQQKLYRIFLSNGERSISMTKLDGVSVLRLVVVSPHTKLEHLLQTIEQLQRLVALDF